MFHYGYFVKLPDGKLVPAGDSWCLSKDSYKVGDSLGVRNGKEGIVVGVIKPMTERQYFDVVVVVEEGDGALSGTEPRVRAVVPTLPSPPPPLPGPTTIQTPWAARNVRAVAIWNTVVFRPLTETFHEFLVEVPLKGTCGEKWYKREMAKREGQPHSVVRWLATLRLQQFKNKPRTTKKAKSLRRRRLEKS